MLEWKRQLPLTDEKGKHLEFVGDNILLRAVCPEANSITLVQKSPASKATMPLPTSNAITLSPHDTLLINAELTEPLHNAFPLASTDLSDRYAVIDISGEAAAERLQEGTSAPLDTLLTESLGTLQARLFDLQVIIRYCADQKSYRVYVDRSMAAQLWLCLTV